MLTIDIIIVLRYKNLRKQRSKQPKLYSENSDFSSYLLFLTPLASYFFLFNKYLLSTYYLLSPLFIYLLFSIFGYIGSSLLRTALPLFVAVHGLLIAVASLVAELRLQVRGLQQLWHAGSVVVARGLQSTGSVVVAHRLICSAACGIFPDQGSNPGPQHWQVDSQPLRHQGSPSFFSNMSTLLLLNCLPPTIIFLL